MRLRFTIFTALIMLCFAAPVLAQMECSALADAGLSTLAANCGDMEANTVCYGSDRVQAVFAADSPPITFDNPGDRAFLSQFAEIQTLPANVAEPQWGIAAIRANVPDDDSEVMATLLLMGDGVLRYTRTLATLGASGRMQSFDVTLASDAAPCAETPSMLVLNADADAELMLNGTKIRFVEASVLVLRQVSANALTLTIESGAVEVDEHNANSGETLPAIADDSGSIILWSDVREFSDEEAQAAGIALEALVRMSSTPRQFADEPTADAEISDDSAETPIVETATMACGAGVVHVVQRGENVYRIAIQYGTTVEAIAAANNLTNPRLIHSGLQLVIPCAGGGVSVPPVVIVNPPPSNAICSGGVAHVVQVGDTLYNIATRYGTTVEAIAAANGIVDINTVGVGQVLVIACS